MSETFALLPHSSDELIAFGAQDRTARDLLADVASLRAALPPSTPGSEILVIAQDRYHFCCAVLAAWQAGHAVALPPNGQSETIKEISARPTVRLLLHDTDADDGLDLRPLLGKSAKAEPLAPIPADRTVATLYTSGSTGQSQACPKSAAQLLGEARAHVGSFSIPHGARFLATVPAHHIYGLLWSVLVPLFARGAFGRETALHAEAIAAQLKKGQARYLVSVPAHLRGLEVLAELPKLERIFSSGAPLPAATAEMISARFGQAVVQVYGSTETGGIAWRDDPKADWTPFATSTIAVAEDGRLLLSSPFVAADAPRPLPCGDQILLKEDGRFALLGRIDGVVKVGGKRVSLPELEQRAMSIPGVKDAAALAESVDGARGEEIWLAAVAPGLTAEVIKGKLLAWFEPVALPRRIRLVERLPREDNGKLTRRRLRALFESGYDPKGAYPKVLEPLASRQRTDGGRQIHELDFFLPEDFLYFQGHFEGYPILPGVVQLHGLVLRQSRRLWPELGAPRKVLKLKFKRIIKPRDTICLRLQREAGKPRVDFEILHGEAACASGTLVFPG